MLISLNWIREFVDLPADLSAEELAERFTLVCAEVEGVEAIEVGASGLICAEILTIESIPGTRDLSAATLNVGSGSVDTMTAAPNLKAGDRVIYAPSGASVKALGTIADSTVADRPSSGMILPGDALGVAMAAREAIFLPPSIEPGTQLDPSSFDDWVVEVDNHSINHRPDLWGHYGIAREFAAIFNTPLKPYPVEPIEHLQDDALPEIPIEIDDADACPRYSAIMMKGVASQPAPLWMQLRLGHVGLRPIDGLVDLTNYIMLELGQPMHAFDGDMIDRIEVGTVTAGTKFTTLDNIERTLPDGALMITSNRRPVALAGIMGGLDTEISDTTQTMLLESANFHPHTIRKCAGFLSHRTDASARFEKSLDPAHTVLAIQRFVCLARNEYKQFKLAGRLSDAYPKPLPEISVMIDPAFVAKFMGHPVTRERITEILTALEFDVTDAGNSMQVRVPSFRATRDIEIEADIIEEVARYVGYNNIEPDYPEVVVRALEPNPQQQIERAALRVMVQGLGMTEVHDYIWYNTEWCNKIGYDPSDCLTLRNPAAAGMERLRQSLLPGLLRAANLNRYNFNEFKLVELGSAFPRTGDEHIERQRIAVVSATRSKTAEDQRLSDLKGAIETWAWQVVSRPVTFAAASPDASRPWEHSAKTAIVRIDGRDVGRISAVPLALRQRIDEHLAAWSMVWAEIDLVSLAGLDEQVSKLPPVPAFPEVDLDFSVLVDANRHYADICEEIARFNDALLRRVSFVDSYEGKSLPAGKRALTFRTRIGDTTRTLEDTHLVHFRQAFQSHIEAAGMELRTG